ncbi:hypothetical protein WG8_0630 [Paenibacillus sp. Aloe-11]|nr:hypothetical protein WG8_0630 [Paenibacillus sp. Aloe-11]
MNKYDRDKDPFYDDGGPLPDPIDGPF